MKDLINDCKTAELHRIGKIQGYGVLLVVDRKSCNIIACSDNTELFLGQSADRILGRAVSDLLDIEIETIPDYGDEYLPLVTETHLDDRPVIVSSHVRGKVVIVEIEPGTDEPPFGRNDRLLFLQKLATTTAPDDAAGLLLKQIAGLGGFDRNMLYKFLPDWHGRVLAEQNKPGVDGFLNLHFPASDIPENARRLYTVNLQRIIVDVNGPQVDIISTDTDFQPDLTYAQLRAVHPVHLQYLQNIGARTSFSISIVVAGKLWGMVACHHLQPKLLDLRIRDLCEELSRIVSLHMTGLLAADTEKRRAGFFAIKAGMQTGMRSGDGLAKTFSKYARELLSTFKADGIWLRIDDQDHQHGVTSTLDSHAVLSDWLAGLDPQQIFHSNSIAPELSPYPDLVRHVSGVLYIPLGERGFVLFCRNEQHENVQWAGRQEVTADGRIDEFTPRNSFEAWTEEVKGQSLDWHVITLESAMRLHEMLLDHLEKTELAQKALQDGLTGLANRTMFESELENAIDVSESTGSIVAVFMLDLDKFKPVNDTWGHGAGDELLIQVGERLQGLVRDRDVVARFGGDEFAVILYHFSGIEEVEMVATRIIDEIRRPFKLKDTDVEIGASLGIALYPEHASGQKELIEKADAALYEVKRSGRNAWRFYEPGGTVSENSKSRQD